MTRYAYGVALQEHFVHQMFVPGRAGRAAAGETRARDHDLVLDCVPTFGDSGFRGAHFRGVCGGCVFCFRGGCLVGVVWLIDWLRCCLMTLKLKGKRCFDYDGGNV